LDRLANSLKQLRGLLGKQEGKATPLRGGITNSNYRARFGGADVVLRLPGEDSELLGIDRESEWVANKLAARIGVAPRVAALLKRPTCLVTHYLEGREMSSEELRRAAALNEVGMALRRFHECGEMLPADFSPFQVVDRYALTAAAHGAVVPEAYDWARPAAMRIEAALRGSEHRPVPCHNDLLTPNFIRTRGGIRIVDWEHAGMGDRYFDLGNFAVNNQLDPEQEEILLTAYFREPVSPPRLAALQLMRFMSDFREAMWGVLKSAISEVEFDFSGYAERHFKRLRETAANPRFEAWLEEAADGAS
jgi:thiamine kinase-like enzyme